MSSRQRLKIEQLEGRLQFGFAEYQSLKVAFRKLNVENKDLRAENELRRTQLQLPKIPANNTNSNTGNATPVQVFAPDAVIVNNLNLYNNPYDVDPQVPTTKSWSTSDRIAPATNPAAVSRIKVPTYRDKCLRKKKGKRHPCNRKVCQYVHPDQEVLYAKVIAALPSREEVECEEAGMDDKSV